MFDADGVEGPNEDENAVFRRLDPSCSPSLRREALTLADDVWANRITEEQAVSRLKAAVPGFAFETYRAAIGDALRDTR